MQPTQRFAGKRAVVVGGASGHGFASSVRLAMEGADVYVIDDRSAPVDEVCAALKAHGGLVRGITVDRLDDAGELLAAADVWGDEVDPLHVLVTNFVTLEWGSFEECPIEQFERVVKFTLVGPAASMKAFLPNLKRADGASIVHIGSIDGLYGNPRAVPYSTAKAGLTPFTTITARELARYDIRVNTVASGITNQVSAVDIDGGEYADSAPSVTATGSTSDGGLSRAPGGWYLEQIARAVPLKRNGPPEEWAGAVAFLASDDASYVSGSVVKVDCGRTGLTTGTFDPEGYGE